MEDSLSHTVFIKLIALIFFVEKFVRSFCTAKTPHIFSAKNASVFVYMYHMFDTLIMLTNDIVSFEQLGPVFHFTASDKST